MEEVLPFIEVYRAAREEEMQIKIERLRKQRRSDSSENLKIQILTAQASLAIHTILLDHIEEIHVEQSAWRFVEEKLNRFSQKLEPVPQAAMFPTLKTHQYGWWIVFEEAIEIPSLPFQIKAAIFAHATDPRLIQKTKSAVQPAAHAMLDEIAAYKSSTHWIIDVIGAEGSIEFCMAYDGLQDKWKHSQEFHVCPWNTCQFKQQGQLIRACNSCNALHSYCRILIKSVDIEEHKVSHTAMRSQKKQHEAERRQNWLTFYSQENIEQVIKPARGHDRHYKDGRVVAVRQSKPRPYHQLKADVAPRRITRLRNKKYEP